MNDILAVYTIWLFYFVSTSSWMIPSPLDEHEKQEGIT